jgi:hypothetical protein
MTLPTTTQAETVLSRLRHRRDLRVFPVVGPMTIYISGSQCGVAVIYHAQNHVELYTSLYAAFGVRVIVEQDEAGIYIVLRRRRLLGLFSRSEVTVKLPTYCHLAFNLTPGTIRIEQLHGTLEIPSLAEMPHKPVVEMPALRETSGTYITRLGAGE